VRFSAVVLIMTIGLVVLTLLIHVVWCLSIVTLIHYSYKMITTDIETLMSIEANSSTQHKRRRAKSKERKNMT